MWNSLPFVNKIVQMLAPTTTNGGATSAVISLKQAIRATIIVDLKQGAGHATAIALRQATDIAAGTTAAGPTSQIWSNEDCAAGDTLVKQTDAASYTVAADVKNKQIIFEIDPAALTDGYDCVYVTAANSSQAGNIANITAIIRTAYQQTTPPSAVVD